MAQAQVVDRRQVAGLVGTLRGSSGVVFLAMVLMRYPQTVMDLAEIIGITRQSVSRGLRHLRAVGVAEKLPGRYGAWALSSQVHQMILGEVVHEIGEDCKMDVTKCNVPCSSSYKIHRPAGSAQGKLPLQERDVIKCNVNVKSPVTLRAISALKGLGCSRSRTEAAVEAALVEWTPERLLAEVLGWVLYCESERGRSLKAPGFFVAARIEDLQEATHVVDADDDDGSRYISGKYADFIQS